MSSPARWFSAGDTVRCGRLQDTAAAGPLLNQAVAAGWLLKRVNDDGIFTGARMNMSEKRHRLDVQISDKPSDEPGSHRCRCAGASSGVSARTPMAIAASRASWSGTGRRPGMRLRWPTFEVC